MNGNGSTARQAAPSRIRSLGYVGLTATDLDVWRRFAVEVCGMAISDLSSADELLLRADERAWRISVTRGDGELAYVGWEVAGAEDLAALAAELDAAGISVEEPGLAEARNVMGLIRVKDPAGNSVEFFYGAKVAGAPFTSPSGVRFVTGEQGLGHVVLGFPDMANAERFYFDTLGFRVSDRIAFQSGSGVFAHVNPRHHSLAIVSSAQPILHHFMLEVSDLDAVGRALDRVLAGQAELKATLGRHSNDHMVSFYAQTPSQCQVEYGWNGLQIDEATWTTKAYETASLWGHRRQLH
jgi:2,3-dihydroxybiphenyl 1,2-dioxygenase